MRKDMYSIYGVYEVRSEIIDIPLAFWTLGEIKTSAQSKAKRKDWTGRNQERKCVSCV